MSRIEESIEIAVSPEVAFDAISDLPSMGRYSPENTGGRWTKGAGPAVGARFKGTNAQGKKEWSTTATVVICDRPNHFAFEVTVAVVKVARWEFAITATPEGCRVTEATTDRRSGLVKRFAGIEGIDDREAYNAASMATTLAALKAHLEAGG
ncbi:MAG: SRPBCC family protein [Actinomycetes bacterium]